MNDNKALVPWLARRVRTFISFTLFTFNVDFTSKETCEKTKKNIFRINIKAMFAKRTNKVTSRAATQILKASLLLVHIHHHQQKSARHTKKWLKVFLEVHSKMKRETEFRDSSTLSPAYFTVCAVFGKRDLEMEYDVTRVEEISQEICKVHHTIDT